MEMDLEMISEESNWDEEKAAGKTWRNSGASKSVTWHRKWRVRTSSRGCADMCKGVVTVILVTMCTVTMRVYLWGCVHYLVVSKTQWMPFWLATALSTEWLDWMAISCELWRIGTCPVVRICRSGRKLIKHWHDWETRIFASTFRLVSFVTKKDRRLSLFLKNRKTVFLLTKLTKQNVEANIPVYHSWGYSAIVNVLPWTRHRAECSDRPCVAMSPSDIPPQPGHGHHSVPMLLLGQEFVQQFWKKRNKPVARKTDESQSITCSNLKHHYS